MKAPHSIFFKQTKGRQNRSKSNPFLRNVSMLLEKKHTFHFICSLFCRFYSNEQSMLKIFFIHIGIVIMLNILSQNVRFSAQEKITDSHFWIF